MYVSTAAKTSARSGETVVVLDNCRNARGAIKDLCAAGYDAYGICFAEDPSVVSPDERVLVLSEGGGFGPLMDALVL